MGILHEDSRNFCPYIELKLSLYRLRQAPRIIIISISISISIQPLGQFGQDWYGCGTLHPG